MPNRRYMGCDGETRIIYDVDSTPELSLTALTALLWKQSKDMPQSNEAETIYNLDAEALLQPPEHSKRDGFLSFLWR